MRKKDRVSGPLGATSRECYQMGAERAGRTQPKLSLHIYLHS